jgi:DNA modification methylase
MEVLIKGDCLTEMASLPDSSIDLCLTDPPYGTTVCKWDSVIPFAPMWKELHRIVKPNGAILLFGSEPFSSALRMSNIKNFKYDWIWLHNRSCNFAQAPYRPLGRHEVISVFSFGGVSKNSKIRMAFYPQGLVECNKQMKGKKHNAHRPSRVVQSDYVQIKTNYPHNILEYSKEAKPVHPTQKPIALLEYLIKTYTLPEELVLDFTMGSGSTGVAAKNLGRDFVGIERDDNYFRIANERIQGDNKEAKE